MTKGLTAPGSIDAPGSPGHAGSASISLTGTGVLAAWLISVALHVVGLGAMFLLVFPFAGKDTESERPFAFAQVVGDVDTPPPPVPVELAAPQPSFEPPDRMIIPRPEDRADALQQLAGSAKSAALPSELSVIGIGAAGSDIGRDTLTPGTGSGPEFFGVGGTAPGVRSIVYVVDRSASMIDTFGAVRVELKRSISALRRSQKFHVIFFNHEEPLENPPGQLVNAIEAYKQQFFDFMAEIYPTGRTRPERAMHRALALKPDLVYLLSDGELFEWGLLTKLDQWNPDRRVKIFTIAYLDPTGRQILEAIAREHGGEFKFVSDDDLP